MPKKTELKARSFLIVNNNTVIPFENLTHDQRNEYIPIIMKNVGRAGSNYLNCHPDEAHSYLERRQMAMTKISDAVAELDRHLNGDT